MAPQPLAALPLSPAAPGSSRTKRDKRAVILDAAIKVFARKGYHGCRVSDIAREADIAYGLVYHYFKNKEEILHTIFEERWSGFLEAVDEIAGRDVGAEDKLVSVAALMLNAYRVRPDWVKVLVLEIQRSSRFAEPGQLRAVGAFFASVARILRAGQQSGELRADLDPDVACYVFTGALEIVITSLVLELIKLDDKAGTESEYYLKVARTVVDIFLHGLARNGAGERRS
jgi:TetR/AcrR family fatty acid metabolism transcriptional regulator